MAQAVERLYPESQCTIGPVIEDGFFYDFSYPPGFTMDDLDRIGAEMRRIVKDALPVTREVWHRGEAIQYFRQEKKNTKPKSSRTCPRVRTSRCTARASLSICAVDRTFPIPRPWASSA